MIHELKQPLLRSANNVPAMFEMVEAAGNGTHKIIF
jgi:hypothetical protein